MLNFKDVMLNSAHSFVTNANIFSKCIQNVYMHLFLLDVEGGSQQKAEILLQYV